MKVLRSARGKVRSLFPWAVLAFVSCMGSLTPQALQSPKHTDLSPHFRISTLDSGAGNKLVQSALTPYPFLLLHWTHTLQVRGHFQQVPANLRFSALSPHHPLTEVLPTPADLNQRRVRPAALDWGLGNQGPAHHPRVGCPDDSTQAALRGSASIRSAPVSSL